MRADTSAFTDAHLKSDSPTAVPNQHPHLALTSGTTLVPRMRQ